LPRPIIPEPEHKPTWALVAGLGIGAFTLLFLMFFPLSALLYEKRIDCGDTWWITLIFALTLGLASAFLGGYATITGNIKVPFLGQEPLATAAVGGIVFVAVGALISYFVTSHGCSPHERPRASQSVVNAFYHDLEVKDYDSAWNHFTLEYQKERWKGNKEAFIDGFLYTTQITLLAIALETPGDDTSDKYVVYYLDEVNAWVIPGLTGLYSKPIKELHTILDDVNKLRDQLATAGYDVNSFDNQLTVNDLMSPNRSIRFAWKLAQASSSNPSPTKFNELFPENKPVTFISAYEVTTHKTKKEGWKISNVSNIRLKD
jgi:hypothetical protein